MYQGRIRGRNLTCFPTVIILNDETVCFVTKANRKKAVFKLLVSKISLRMYDLQVDLDDSVVDWANAFLAFISDSTVL